MNLNCQSWFDLAVAPFYTQWKGKLVIACRPNFEWRV